MAREWERLGWPHPLALYCRLFARAEQPNAQASLLAGLRQIGDQWGRSPLSHLRLRWQIVDEPEQDVDPEMLDIRDRLRR